eukprot:CAMPEP_0175139568 /NCGR_PEP_ID=MMETSP0087-20121206/10977_1 /TAXON_ID=136419 /ORGANISM="Unknown Unknown, Strain D1" /LENGTH=622 /DNA_ID=CAMNT_0016422597 /DNA_START=135 /DNA_END=2003 /DNA_ORIENTATION=-
MSISGSATRLKKGKKGTKTEEKKTGRGTTKQLTVKRGTFLKTLLKVLVRGMGTREWLNLITLSGSLLARTYLSLWIASNMGDSIQHFCNKDWRKVAGSINQFAKSTVMAAGVNALLKLCTDLLATNLRSTLTRKAHALYFERMNYYTANKVGNDKFECTDQLIAEDISQFSVCAAEVYSQSLKPVVDFAIFSLQLGTKIGPEGPLGMWTWFFVAAAISARVLPPYGRLAAEEQALEGRFRSKHAELIHNGEMVAFMRGEKPELSVLTKAFKFIRQHSLGVLKKKFISDFIQGYTNKYFASVVGFSLIARPVYINYNGMGEWKPGKIASYYVQTRQTLEGLATAVLALFELQKRFGRLGGLSARVEGLFEGLEKRDPILVKETQKCVEEGNPPIRHESDTLRFEKVDIYKPDGVLLLKHLTIEVPRGTRVMITGDNGCGKSSLFRVMCGLWPLVGGTLYTPNPKNVYFLSQVNFVPVGSLRDIIIYPEEVNTMHAKGMSDDDLRRVLKWAHLEGFKCDGVYPSLDDTLEWNTALSPGQKQRMAFARLLYHQPTYAILDECTNGIAPAIEKDLYERCSSLGMSIFSISHKNELKLFHDFELHYNADEAGTWEWIDLKKATNRKD